MCSPSLPRVPDTPEGQSCLCHTHKLCPCKWCGGTVAIVCNIQQPYSETSAGHCRQLWKSVYSTTLEQLLLLGQIEHQFNSSLKVLSMRIRNYLLPQPPRSQTVAEDTCLDLAMKPLNFYVLAHAASLVVLELDKLLWWLGALSLQLLTLKPATWCTEVNITE